MTLVQIWPQLGVERFDWEGCTETDLPDDDAKIVTTPALQWPAGVIAHGGRMADEVVLGHADSEACADDLRRARRYLPDGRYAEAETEARRLVALNEECLRALAQRLCETRELKGETLETLLETVVS